MTSLGNNERIPKATREKQVVTYKEAPIRLSSDFSTETFQARRDWHEIFKVMKSKDIQPSKDIEREIKSFPDTKKAKGVC